MTYRVWRPWWMWFLSSHLPLGMPGFVFFDAVIQSAWRTASISGVLGTIYLVRSLMMSLTVSADGIVARNLIRTHRYKWHEISGIEGGLWAAFPLEHHVAGAVQVNTTRARKPASWGPDRWATKPLTPFPWLFDGDRPSRYFTAGATAGLAGWQREELVSRLCSIAAAHYVQCRLEVRDLSFNVLHQAEWERHREKKAEKKRVRRLERDRI